VLILACIAVSIVGWARRPQPLGLSSEGDRKTEVRKAPSERFPVTIRRPQGPPTIVLQQPDALGRSGRIACSTCHSLRAANLENRQPSDFDEFHQNLKTAHGDLACYSCHNPDDTDTLRLADGRQVEYANVINLCRQCHGAQAEAYARGFHGGMAGYWDLTRGQRVRNNCVDCHDPHRPQFPMMQPTFKPRDRFLTPSDGHGHEPSSHSEVDGE
jgi:hypothetical protein